MKYIAISMLLTAAMPALAQQTQAPAPQTQPQPAGPAGPDAVAGTPLSNSPAPSDGPRSDQANVPSNDAAANAGGGLAPPTVPAPPAGATVIAAPSPSAEQAFPPPPPLDHYPICKAHQFDKCMEPGPRVHRKHR